MSTRRAQEPATDTTTTTPKNQRTQPPRDRRAKEGQPRDNNTRNTTRPKNASANAAPILTVIRPTSSTASELVHRDADTPATTDTTTTTTPASARATSATTTSHPQPRKSSATARTTTAPAVTTTRPPLPASAPAHIAPEEPVEPAQPDAATSAATQRTTTTPDHNNALTKATAPDTGQAATGRLGPGELRRMVHDHLRDHQDRELTPSQLSNLLGRSSGAINNALETLRSHGVITRTKDRPRTYRFTGEGASSAE